MNKIVLFSIILFADILLKPCFGQAKLDVTYIANAGFLIESRGKKILIDALFKNGWGNYLTPVDSIVSKIIDQQAPFNNVHLMLITHDHEDHFNDTLVVAYLNMNRENVLIAPPKVINKVLKNPDLKTGRNQTVNMDKVNRDKNDTTINGIRVTSFFMQHDARSHIENAGYLIAIEDVKVFHTGDYNGSEIIEFGKLQLQREQIDLAILNFYGFWSTKEERKFTEEYILPEKITLMHIPTSEIEIVKDSVKQVHDFIDISIFERSMQKKSFTFF